MAELRINIIPFDITAPDIPLYISDSESHFSKKQFNKLPKEIQKDFPEKCDTDLLFWSFSEVAGSKKYEIKIKDNPTFAKPYIDKVLFKYFQDLGFITFKSYIDDISIWIKQDTSKVQKCLTYQTFSLKIEYNKYKREYGLLLSYDGEAFVVDTPTSRLSLTDKNIVSKAICGNVIYRKAQLVELFGDETNEIFPVLNRKIRKELGIVSSPSNPYRNSYKEYFDNIERFYKQYLSGQSINSVIQIFSSGFKSLNENDILTVDKSRSNKLLFANNETHFNIYNGLKLYGPYKKPENSNVKFIFIFSESDKDTANQLYTQLKKGYKSFTGLEQFVSLPFLIDIGNSITFKDGHQLEAIKSHFDSNTIDTINSTYIAIYISPYSKEILDDTKRLVYFRVKEYLLSKNISSQVIFKDNILKDEFNYFLPNISIALLAKAGGVPWRLSRPIGNNLIIGFGAKRDGDNKYVGNTVAFTNDGVFQKFNSFSSEQLNGLGGPLKEAMEGYLTKYPDKATLIIHYYKTMSYREEEDIKSVLKKLNLKIPYVVLTINETKSKDYVCFDTSFNGIMPVSGTIIKLSNGEYLLCNNTRYSNDTTTRIDGYPLPIKIKIGRTEFINTNDAIVVQELIDQVYQFSRMYWKSVRQKSRPVTIEYSEIIADIAANFESESLPDTRISKETLWFL